MNYQLSRNGQSYGPYTLDDLHRYLASGNVLPTDLVKNDDMPEWLPVSQVLAGSSAAPPVEAASPQAGFAPPAYADPVYAPAGGPAVAASAYPDAPNLHWGFVLLFGLLTGTLFMFVWNLIVAAWLKRVQPNATSLYYYIGFGVLTAIQLAVAVPYTLHQVLSPGMHMSFVPGVHMSYNPVGGLVGLIAWIVKLIARFSQRTSLEEHFNTAEPVGLRLSAAMTFFFGGLYFQYHLNRINAMKQAARYGAPRAY